VVINHGRDRHTQKIKERIEELDKKERAFRKYVTETLESGKLINITSDEFNSTLHDIYVARYELKKLLKDG